jgi:hypothetical protein
VCDFSDLHYVAVSEEHRAIRRPEPTAVGDYKTAAETPGNREQRAIADSAGMEHAY